MPFRFPLAAMRCILPFETDRPVPYVLIWSLALVATGFCIVYWSATGFSGL
jgi:hypothetical protein